METGNELTAHLTTGAAIVYTIQWLKLAHWFPWLDVDAKRACRVISALAAGVAAIGIGWTYQADVANGTLVITGLSAHAVMGAGWEWLKQIASQQLIYDAAVAERKVQVVSEIRKDGV